MINLKFNTVNRRILIDLFGPHHVSSVDDEQNVGNRAGFCGG